MPPVFKEIIWLVPCCLSRLRRYRDTSCFSLSAKTNVSEAEMTLSPVICSYASGNRQVSLGSFVGLTPHPPSTPTSGSRRLDRPRGRPRALSTPATSERASAAALGYICTQGTKRLLPEIRSGCRRLSAGLAENRSRRLSGRPAARQRRHRGKENGARPQPRSPPRSWRVRPAFLGGPPDQTQKEKQPVGYLHPAPASVDATSLFLGSAVTSSRLPPPRGGRRVRFPRSRGRCRESARPRERREHGALAARFQPERSNAPRPFPNSPFWGLGRWTGPNRKRKNAFPVAP